MANYFDQFDAPSQRPKGNYFDQFDAGAKPAQQPGVWSDIKNTLATGFQGLALDAREIARRAFGEKFVGAVDTVDEWMHGKPSEELIKGNIEKAQQALTPEMSAAMQKTWWDDETNSLGDAWSDPRAYLGNVMQSLPGTAVTMLPAIGIARGIYVAERAALIAGGMAEREAVTLAAAKAATTAQLAGGLTEGLQQAGQTGREVRDQILALSEDQLSDSDALKSIMDTGLSFDDARAKLAEDASAKAMTIAGVATGIFGGMGDRVLAKAFTKGLSGNLATRITKGAAAEGVIEELPQSYLSKVGENIGMQEAVPGTPTTQGALSEGLGGMVAGGIMGGGIAAASKRDTGPGLISGARPPTPSGEPTPTTDDLVRNIANSDVGIDEFIADTARATGTLQTGGLIGGGDRAIDEAALSSQPPVIDNPEPVIVNQPDKIEVVDAVPRYVDKWTSAHLVNSDTLEYDSRPFATEAEARADGGDVYPPLNQAQVISGAGPANNPAVLAVNPPIIPDETPTPVQESSAFTNREQPEITMAEVDKVRDIPTVEMMREAIAAVGEDEFQRQAQAKIEKYKPTSPDQEAMLVEATATEIVVKNRRKPVSEQPKSRQNVGINVAIPGKSPAVSENGPETGQSKYADFLGAVGKRLAMEDQAQAILDDIEEAGVSPQTIAKQFWSQTFFDMPAPVQRRFERMLKANTGIEPGSAVAKAADGTVTRAENWQDVADQIGLPATADYLEGTERGFVALMHEANRRFAQNAPETRQTAPGEALPAPATTIPAQPVAPQDAAKTQPPATSTTGFVEAFRAADTTADLYQRAFTALTDGKTTISGVKDPILVRAKPAFDAGMIKSPDDIKRFENSGYPETKTPSALPEKSGVIQDTAQQNVGTSPQVSANLPESGTIIPKTGPIVPETGARPVGKILGKDVRELSDANIAKFAKSKNKVVADLAKADQAWRAANVSRGTPQLPPVAAAMVDAGQQSVADLRGRISDVKYGPVENGKETIQFNLDGKPHQGVLTGRNKDVVIGHGKEADAGIAARVLLDGQAQPAESPKPAAPVAEAALSETTKEPWQMTKAEWLATPLYARRESGGPYSGGVLTDLTKKEAGPTGISHAELNKTNAAASRRKVALLPERGTATGHRVRVMDALAAKKPVPSNVLADYPDLAKPAAESTPEPPVSAPAEQAASAEKPKTAADHLEAAAKLMREQAAQPNPEARPASPVAEKYPRVTKFPGDSQEKNDAQNRVVDAMNGEITVDQLIDELRETGLPNGTLAAITNRLGDKMSPKQQRRLLAPRQDSGGPDVESYSRGELPRLSVLHNLNAENLIFADKLGGLAVPSLGVVTEGMGISGMGDITLIGRKDLANPAEIPIHDADVYSNTFPRAEYDKVRSADAQKVLDEIKPFAKRFDDYNATQVTWDNAVNSPDPQKIVSTWANGVAAKAMFLREKGVTVEPVMTTKQVHFPWVQFLDWDKFRETMPFNDERAPDVREKAFSLVKPLVRSAINKYLMTTKDGRAVLKLATNKADAMQMEAGAFGVSGDWINTDEPMPPSLEWKIHESKKNFGAPEVDRGETRKVLDAALKSREAEFKQWVDDKVMGMFGRPFIRDRGRKYPYNLENIVDAMTGRVRAREDTMTFGEGKARAAAAKRFKDLEQMRRAAENVADESEIKESRETAKKLIEEWRGSVISYYGEPSEGGNQFGRVWEGLDASMKAMARWARGAKTEDNMRSALVREGFRTKDMPEFYYEDGVAAGMAWLRAPVPYFEAKPQRAVKLSEFAGAVIPENTSEQAREVLDKNNVPYRTYKGDASAQQKAADEFRTELAAKGEDVLFARGGQSPGLPAAEIRAHIAWITDRLSVAVPVYDTVEQARLAGFKIADDAQGFAKGDRLGLISANIKTLLQAEETTFHELWHVGIKRITSNPDAVKAFANYVMALNKVAIANPEVRKRANEWRDKYGEDKRAQFEAVGVKGPELDLRIRTQSFDEAVASIAGENRPVKFLTELMASLQRLVRALGFDELASWMEGKTDAEVLSLIRAATQSVSKGTVSFGGELAGSGVSLSRDDGGKYGSRAFWDHILRQSERGGSGYSRVLSVDGFAAALEAKDRRTNSRGSPTILELDEGDGGTPQALRIAYWPGKLAGQEGHYSVADVINGNFVVSFIPESLAPNENDYEAFHSASTQGDASILRVAFIRTTVDGTYELSVSDPQRDSAVFNLLRDQGRIEATGKADSKGGEYFRVKFDNKPSDILSLLTESVRRLAINDGAVPTIIRPMRDTGANPHRARLYTPQNITESFSRLDQTQTAEFRPASTADMRTLKIPPGWTDVYVSTEPTAALMAVGADSKGRQQYLYSASHTTQALREKFERQRRFNDALPRLMEQIERDVANKNEEAHVLRLIAHTGFRVGNEAIRGDVEAIGATTLRSEHVSVDGDTIYFDFAGKRGIHQEHVLVSDVIAADISARIARGHGKIFNTNDGKVRRYLRSLNDEFLIHDFRTWNATDAARQAIAVQGMPNAPAAYWDQRDEVADVAAAKIGDTRAVALESYIDPKVFDAWRIYAGIPENAERPRKSGKRRAGNDARENRTDERVFRDPSLSGRETTRIGGAFATDPDIMHVRAGGLSWDAPEPSKMDNLIYSLQDKQIDTKRVLEQIRKHVAVSDTKDVRLQEELYHGRTAKLVDDFLNTEMRPLVAEMVARKVTMPEFEEYLHARHAEEANAVIAARNPTMPDGGSGMDTQDARDYLSSLDLAKKRAYEALAQRVDAINGGSRQMLVDYGLESQDTINTWKAAYKNYVPLHREDMGGGPGIGQGFSVRGPASKMRTGSSRKVVNIIANIAMQREKNIVRGEKNRVALALYGLAKDNPNPDFWSLAKPGVTTQISAETGDPVDVIDMSYQGRDNVVMSRMPDKTGKIVQHGVEFNQHDERAMRMAAALKNLDMDDLGHVLGMSAKITRYFASVNTQYNPVFGVVNITRDVQGAMFNLSSTELAGHQAEVLKNTLSALRGIYIDTRDTRQGKPATSAWAQLWEEFQTVGGKTGYRDMFRTSNDRAEAIEREIAKVTEGKAKQFGRAVFDWLSDYNTAGENAVRLAAYKAGIDAGMTKQRAASLAKNLTVNFNRKGQIATQAGALYAFFNASVQGTARLAETLTGPTGRKIIIGGITLGAVQALMLAAAGFDDDEPPEFIRERSTIIPIGDKKYITIPMPLGLHFIPNIGRIATEFTLSGFKNPAKRVMALANVFADAFNPVGSSGLSLQTITPTVIDPIAALAENKDWTGKPITRQDMSQLSPTPGHTRAKDTASAFSKATSKAINYLTGGTDYKPGIFSPSPDAIDYLIGQATGGVGRETMKLEQSIASALTGEDLPTYKIPLVGRFYGDSEQQSSQGNAFYSNLKEINEHEAEIKGRRKAGEPIGDYFSENPEARLIQYANATERQVSQLRKRKRELMAKDADSGTVKAVDLQITARMKLFNDRVKQVSASAP